MADDDYAIMPQKEIRELKEEVERLKKNPLGENKTSNDLMGSIETLTKSMRDLMDLFREASKEMKAEDSETGGKQLTQLNEKLDNLIEQNQKIAKGIVTVADLLNKKEEAPPEPKPQPRPAAPPDPFGMPPGGDPFGAPPPMGPPPPLGPPGAPPENMPPPGMGPMPPPPAAPEPEKKGGLFHRK